MATRSLTEVFILMRNNALQSRHIFSEQVSNSTSSSCCLSFSDDSQTTLFLSLMTTRLNLIQ